MTFFCYARLYRKTIPKNKMKLASLALFTTIFSGNEIFPKTDIFLSSLDQLWFNIWREEKWKLRLVVF